MGSTPRIRVRTKSPMRSSKFFNILRHRQETHTALFCFSLVLEGGVIVHPLLTPYKRDWNRNVERYGSVWDPEPVLRALMAVPFDVLTDPKNLQTLRAHLILSSRLLCLYRSHDLANLKRTVSVLSGKVPFVRVKRKGQQIFK